MTPKNAADTRRRVASMFENKKEIKDMIKAHNRMSITNKFVSPKNSLLVHETALLGLEPDSSISSDKPSVQNPAD